MSRALTTIEEVEIIAADKSGAIDVLLKELKKKDLESEELSKKNLMNDYAIAELTMTIALK